VQQNFQYNTVDYYSSLSFPVDALCGAYILCFTSSHDCLCHHHFGLITIFDLYLF